MKRDMDLVREILLRAEKSESSDISVPISIEGYSEEQIKYHLKLLSDTEFITPKYAEFKLFDWGGGSTSKMVDDDSRRLTWQAHEFLDNARDETRWNEAKKIAGQKGGSMAFDVVKGVLVQLALRAVGL
jgi:Hypothetical protein (DUF2513)